MIFNQYVQQQALFNALHAAEILDPATTDDRLMTLGVAAGNLSEGLHLDGIGQANAYGDERPLLFGDVGVAAILIAALPVIVVQALV
jgi:hypothetical protein